MFPVRWRGKPEHCLPYVIILYTCVTPIVEGLDQEVFECFDIRWSEGGGVVRLVKAFFD